MFYVAPAQNFGDNGWSESFFITSSTSEIFSWKEYKFYFSQFEMITSNIQLGYVLTMGGGQAVQAGLSSTSEMFSWKRC